MLSKVKQLKLPQDQKWLNGFTEFKFLFAEWFNANIHPNLTLKMKLINDKMSQFLENGIVEYKMLFNLAHYFLTHS